MPPAAACCKCGIGGGFFTLLYALNFDVPEVTSGTRQRRLEYVERRLKSYREEVNETAGLFAAS